MSDLPPYRPATEGVQPCVKCGWAGSVHGTRYLPPGAIDPSSAATMVGECLIRSCSRCGYTWAEAVLSPEERPA